MKFFSVSFIVTLILALLTPGSSQDIAKDDNKTDTNARVLSTPEECARQCVEGEKPKTCYYHFTVEYYATLTRACNLCRSNTTTRLTPDCQCITADGYELSGIITANRMHPGPAIMVCLNDHVVIDVVNHVPGNGITIHWHGIFQRNYPYYDGVPYVTQCPILEGSTFRYQWKAENSGTFFWHSHSGLQKGDGLCGSLVVRKPKQTEPYNHLWDYDDFDNVIFITDLFHNSAAGHYPGTVNRGSGQEPDNLLINGLGQWTDPRTGIRTITPLANITVKSGYRYRFRMINACSFMCPVQLTIQGHSLTIIATDGVPIEPVIVDSITSLSAERYDFVLNADKPSAQYWIQLRALGFCAAPKTQQVAVLSYESAIKKLDLLKRPTYDKGLHPGVILNPLNVHCGDSPHADNFLCVTHLKSAREVPPEILQDEPDLRLYFPFGFYTYPIEDVFQPGTYRRFLATSVQVAATVSNISNVFPSSPYLSQRESIPEKAICSADHLPEKCEHTRPCTCFHVEKVPVNAVVEIILVDEVQQSGVTHPFHLHGHIFYVIGGARGSDHNVTNITHQKVKELHESGAIKRNLKSPVGKDTYAVPNKGYSVIRFQAINPGYWLFHCHIIYHLEIGMSLVLQVGEQSDLPPVPEEFPTCKDYVPPIVDSEIPERKKHPEK